MAVETAAQHEKLAARQLPERHWRMRGEERLQRGRVLRPDRTDKPRNGVRIKAVLLFVLKDDRRLASRLALQTGNQQARGPDAETAKRDAALVVQRDGPAAE